MNEIRDRFKMIMEHVGLAAGAFAESIGASQATISHILSGRNNPSVELMLRIHQRYEDINLEWLLTGKGDMSSNNSENAIGPIHDGTLEYPLFAENTKNTDESLNISENRKEMPLKRPENAPKDNVRQEIIYKERPPRKITEIRIFFDDNTYETFKPAN